jgi:flagellar hook-length control protein FliK
MSVASAMSTTPQPAAGQPRERTVMRDAASAAFDVFLPRPAGRAERPDSRRSTLPEEAGPVREQALRDRRDRDDAQARAASRDEARDNRTRDRMDASADRAARASANMSASERSPADRASAEQESAASDASDKAASDTSGAAEADTAQSEEAGAAQADSATKDGEAQGAVAVLPEQVAATRLPGAPGAPIAAANGPAADGVPGAPGEIDLATGAGLQVMALAAGTGAAGTNAGTGSSKASSTIVAAGAGNEGDGASAPSPVQAALPVTAPPPAQTPASTSPAGSFAAIMSEIAGEAAAPDASQAGRSEAGSVTQPGMLLQASQAAQTTEAPRAHVAVHAPLALVPIEIGLKAAAGLNRFEIRLDPEELGRIDVRLDLGDDGSVSAKLVVDRVETLALLQRDARTLERAFEQIGLKTSGDGIAMTLRDPGSDERERQEQSPTSGRAAFDRRGEIDTTQAPQPETTTLQRWWRPGGVDLRI